jgi:hypothetical protein
LVATHAWLTYILDMCGSEEGIEKNDRVTLVQTERDGFGVFFGHVSFVLCNGGSLMSRILVTYIAVTLGAYPCIAASPKIEEVIKTFNGVSADAERLKIFCDMTKAMDAMGDKQNAADEAKVQGYVKQLGTEFETAWNAISDVDAETPDGRAISAALDDVAGKCP